MLGLRVGVGNDAGTRLHRCAAVRRDEHRADGDGGIEVAGEVEVADHARIRSASRRLELIDDLHRPHLRRSADGPGRERGPEHVDRPEPFAKTAGDLRGEVHHVGVVLQRHQLFHRAGAEVDDTTDIVAGEVDEHDMLGNFLRMLLELARETTIVFLGLAPPTGAGDRS